MGDLTITITTMSITVHASGWPLCHMQEPFGPRKRRVELRSAERKWKTSTVPTAKKRAMSGLCSLLELRFVMWGAAPRRLRRQNRAAWFLFFFLLLSLNNTMSQGGQELVHVREDSDSSLIVGGGGEHEQQQQQQLSRLGSRPPFCERKCGGCAPCTAVQVRAAEGQLRPQCVNYEPVGWKCKCGAAVFDP